MVPIISKCMDIINISVSLSARPPVNKTKTKRKLGIVAYDCYPRILESRSRRISGSSGQALATK